MVKFTDSNGNITSYAKLSGGIIQFNFCPESVKARLKNEFEFDCIFLPFTKLLLLIFSNM